MRWANILLLGISMIFIAVGIVIFPVVQSAAATILNDTATYHYTGLANIVKVTPLLVLIGFISAAVVSGFFGVKNIIKGE